MEDIVEKHNKFILKNVDKEILHSLRKGLSTINLGDIKTLKEREEFLSPRVRLNDLSYGWRVLVLKLIKEYMTDLGYEQCRDYHVFKVPGL